MADTFIDIASQAAVIATALDSMSLKALRPKYIFDGVASGKVWNLNAMPRKGDTIEWPVLAAFSSNTAALDPTSTAINGGGKTTYTRASVAMDAYGDYSVIDTFEFGSETFIDIVSDVAFSLQDQGANSINLLARAVIDKNKYANSVSGTLSSSYHYYGSQGTASSVGPLKAKDVREIVRDMKADHVSAFDDGFYVAIVHPTQANQIKAETGNASWGAAVLAGDQSIQQRFTGDIGTFEGARFIVDTQVSGGATGTMSAYFMGKEGVGKAIGRDLNVSLKPYLDGPHSNLLTVRWNALIGYGVIRRQAVRIIECSSTVL